ncbi:MAG TPA: PEGA domain-containing protein [Minicystis sp.]|nr:PEGA domain-containing protein [Minicystis sp.]
MTSLASTAAAAPPKKAAPAAQKPLTDKQKKDLAKKTFGEAQKKFEAGDYAGAVVLYKQADDLIPGARPKYQIAKSLDKLNKVPEAVSAYQVFLDSHPDPDKMKDPIADATARLDALKKTPGKVHINVEPPAVLKTPKGVAITVDNKVPPNAPEPATFVVAPGHHVLEGKAEGYEPARVEFDLNYAESRDVTLTFKEAAPPPPPPVAAAPAPAPAPPPPPPPAPRSPVPAYVTLGLAGAGVVVGTIFGITALSAKSTFKDKPTTDNADAVDRDALISDMSFAVALTFGVTGAVLLLSNNDTAAEKTGATQPAKSTSFLKRGFIAPFVGPTGGGAVGTFKF